MYIMKNNFLDIKKGEIVYSKEELPEHVCAELIEEERKRREVFNNLFPRLAIPRDEEVYYYYSTKYNTLLLVPKDAVEKTEENQNVC